MPKHAVFDAQSHFNLMRTAFGDREPTIERYLAWLGNQVAKTQAVGAKLAGADAWPSTLAFEQAAEPGFVVPGSMAAVSPSRFVLGLGEGPAQRFDRATITVPSESTLSQFSLQSNKLPPNVSCRVFLFHASAIEQLRRTDPSWRESSDEEMIEDAFDNGRVQSSFPIARLLSGLPTQSGRANANGVLKFQFDLPKSVPNLSEETWLALAFDAAPDED